MLGSVITYNGTPIAFFVRRQLLVALSTSEADYMAIVNAMRLPTALAHNQHTMRLIGTEPVQFFIENEPFKYAG